MLITRTNSTPLAIFTLTDRCRQGFNVFLGTVVHHSFRSELFLCVFTEFYENKEELKLDEYLDWISLEKSNLTASTLRFPGKLAWHPAGKRLAVSDTGQHRVLITNSSGVVEVSRVEVSGAETSPGQRPPPPGQRPSRQRPPNPLDRDPHPLDRDPPPTGQRPTQIETPSPWTETPWTEALLDRDPLLDKDAPGQRPAPPPL